jgi:hypothetical protein
LLVEVRKSRRINKIGMITENRAKDRAARAMDKMDV